jgi:hypothetical protein
MRGRKGASGHIEVIISFTIFLAFVTFLLIFVNPIEKTKETNHYIDITEKTLMENIETDLTSFSITIEPAVISSVTGCFCFDYPVPDKVAAEDEDGIKTNAGTFPGNYVCVNPAQTAGGSNKKHYKIHFSPEFAESTGGCTGPGGDFILGSSDYALGVRNEYKKVSKSQLLWINTSYNSNYHNLRATELNLKNNFNIVVKSLDGENLVYGKIKEPKEINIMAKEIPIEILDEHGRITPAIINLQVWE